MNNTWYKKEPHGTNVNIIKHPHQFEVLANQNGCSKGVAYSMVGGHCSTILFETNFAT